MIGDRNGKNVTGCRASPGNPFINKTVKLHVHARFHTLKTHCNVVLVSILTILRQFTYLVLV